VAVAPLLLAAAVVVTGWPSGALPPPADPAGPAGPAVASTETLDGEPEFVRDAEGRLVRQPELRVAATPIYPESLRAQGIEGTVVVAVTIDTTGRVRAAEVHRSDHAALEPFALAAARHTRWLPGAVAGGPRVSVMALPYRFQLLPPAAD
jgi:protein TonB